MESNNIHNDTPCLLLLSPFAMLAAATATTAPTVVIQSTEMRPGTTLMDVVYPVNDPDDAVVKTRALAFIGGVRPFANVIRPVTFLEGTGANIGDAVAANVDRTPTWDVASAETRISARSPSRYQPPLPRLRSGHRLFQRPSPRKQIPAAS